MEDFFERIRKPQLGADEGYIRSEASRLRAYLYTLARDEDRQREVERIQIDLFHWFYAAFNSLKNQVLTLAFQYAIALVGGVKKELRINHSPQFLNFSKGPIETLYDRLDKTKLSQILFVIGGGNLECWDINCTHLPEKQPQTQPRELPKALRGAKAKHLLDWARKEEQGLLDKDYYWIGGSIALCAFFCACINKHCDIHAKGPKKEGGEDRNEWKLYERFFFKDGKCQGREVDLSNNFGTLRKIKLETLNKGIYRKILDHCGLSLTKIVPKDP